MHTLPATAREVRLVARPEGLPTPGHFAVVETALPRPAPGEVLLRNLCFRVSASMRMMISEGAEAVEGVPVPALRPGDTLAGEAVGEVLAAPPGSGLRPGALVVHRAGWREYAAVPATAVQPLPEGVEDPAARLTHGWTAYAALTRGVRLRPGDTVFVSGSGGAIGSAAGQIARALGAGRVVGSAGSRERADRLVAGFGYDAVAVRGAGPFAEQLAEAAPDGLDVVVDNVGGEQLSAAVALANHGARILVLGALSGQLAAHGTGRTAPVELDSFPLLLKKLTLRGYSADDDPDAEAEWYERCARWRASGTVNVPLARVRGLENAPQALADTIAGRHLGTVIVEP